MHVNDIHQCPAKLELYLFAYDNNVHYAEKNFRALETVANAELRKRYDWYKFTCTSNKLTLSTQATNPAMFVTFHPKHMRPDYKPNISLYLTMREMEMLLLDLRIILILSNGPPKNDIT